MHMVRRIVVVMMMVSATVIGVSRSVSAQGFQGGLRGAIHDAGGAVPVPKASTVFMR